MVHGRAAADSFYREELGFRVMVRVIWHGGKTEDRVDYVDMRVPEGSDWLEYTLNVNNPSPKTRGLMHHLRSACLISIRRKACVGSWLQATPAAEDWSRRKVQLNLYEPDLTRAEVMKFSSCKTRAALLC